MGRLADADRDDMETFQTPGSFTFSGTKISKLEASEFTLAAIAVDRSGSIASFERDLEKCLGKSSKLVGNPRERTT